MRWGLRKEARGRHALGAAVTAIPAAPPRTESVPILADQAWSERFPDAQADTQPVAVVADPVPAEPAPLPVVPAQVVPQESAAPATSAAPMAVVAEADVRHMVPVQHPPVQHEVPPVLLESFSSTAPPLQASVPLVPSVAASPVPTAAPSVPAEPPAAATQPAAAAPVVAPEPLLHVPAARPSPEPVPSRAPELLNGFAALAAFRPAVPMPAPPSATPAVPVPPAPPTPAAPTGPRVEIGFADGTFRMLDPASSAARELSELVAELTSKDTGRGATAS